VTDMRQNHPTPDLKTLKNMLMRELMLNGVTTCWYCGAMRERKVTSGQEEAEA